MIPAVHNPAQYSPPPQAGTIPKAEWLEFVAYLVRKNSVKGNLLSNFEAVSHSLEKKKLRDLWEVTELSASDFADEVARFYQLPRVDLAQMLAASSLAAKFTPRFLREKAAFACRFQDSTKATLVVGDPTDLTTVRGVELLLGEPVTLAVGSFEDVALALSQQLGGINITSSHEGEIAVTQHDDDIDSLRDLASGAPVVRAVNNLLERAMEMRATDIHIEPFRKSLVLRMRIDGLLRIVPTPTDVLPQALVSRIKIIAGLNIAERRLPQDGAAHLRIERSEIDVRVATMPTQHGESAVIRLLPKERGVLDIEKLGFCSADEVKLKQLLTLPHGMLVVTGPTGSGKTTTLATMLTILNDTARKILTVEDPIEYEIHGVNQSQVKPEIGLTFAAALRAFVRQDPDVIMVGEVRDAETAHIAIHAALTGHLVLTTLHTETAAAAVPRLLDLGVEPFLLQSTLRAVLAQRLVRVLCERCKNECVLTASAVASPPYSALRLRDGESVYEPASCDRCNGTGYKGRTGIFEILETSSEVQSLIGARSNSGAIVRSARASGMTTMFEHGVAKCRAGITSAAEVLRVATAEVS